MDAPTSDRSADRPADRLIARLQADLREARRARDTHAIAARRTLLAAIQNAEAPAVDTDGAAPPPTVGRLVDVARDVLTDADLDAIVDHEIADRMDTIHQIEPYGRADEVVALQAEIEVIRPYRR